MDSHPPANLLSRRPPIAYLITFSTYASWLHGDRRRSVDPSHNTYGGPFVMPDQERRDHEANLSCGAVTLNAPQRHIVEATITEVCGHRGWRLHAVNARTQHVHAVILADVPPERVMNALKSYCTRRLAERGLCEPGARMWTRHGSTRYLWTEESVARAVDYVLNGQ